MSPPAVRGLMSHPARTVFRAYPLLPLWCTVTASLVLAVFLQIRQSPVADQATTAVVPVELRPLLAVESSLVTVDVEFPPDAAATQAWLIIGSLGDAGTVYPLRWDAIERMSKPRQQPPEYTAVRKGREAVGNKSLRIMPAAFTQETRRPVETTDAPVRERSFFLQTGSDPSRDNSYEPVLTTLVAKTAGVRIWKEVGLTASVDADFVARLADCLDHEILPQIKKLLGEITDLDADGTLAICLTSKLASFPVRDTPVHGLVQLNDFQSQLPRPFSNDADVMFLSPETRLDAGGKAVLAHEAAHLATFSRRREINRAWPQFDSDWLNEGLAHAAEIACTGDWSNLHSRWQAFLANSAASPLEVHDARRQQLWRNAGVRGAAWSFVAWLADEYGDNVLRELAEHPATGREKLEQVAQEPFAELFRHWSVTVSNRSGSSQNRRTDRNQELAVLSLNSPGEMSLAGTSWLACRMSPEKRAPRAVRITAPCDCQLQMTMVRMRDGQLEMQRIR